MGTSGSLLSIVNTLMGSADEHPNKTIRGALKFAEERGWRLKKSGPRAHSWGKMFCGSGCVVSIWSTPRNPENHAKQLRKSVVRCPHQER